MKNTLKTLAIIAVLTSGAAVFAQELIPISINVGTSGKNYFEITDSVNNKCSGRAYPGTSKTCTYTPEEFKKLTIYLQETGANGEKVGLPCQFGNPTPGAAKNILGAGGGCRVEDGQATINNDTSPLAINLP